MFSAAEIQAEREQSPKFPKNPGHYSTSQHIVPAINTGLSPKYPSSITLPFSSSTRNNKCIYISSAELTNKYTSVPFVEDNSSNPSIFQAKSQQSNRTLANKTTVAVVVEENREHIRSLHKPIFQTSTVA